MSEIATTSRELMRRVGNYAERAVKTLARRIVTNKENTDANRRWGYNNSALFLHPEEVGTASFQEFFVSTLPEGETSLKDYVEKTFADKEGEVVGIELGGLGSNVFSRFKEGFLKQSAGIALTDYRDQISPDIRVEDERINHTVIPGDLLKGSTKEKVDKWLEGRKIDFIFERMIGGHVLFPKDPKVMGEQIDFWYQHLADGGLVFAEIPYHSKNLIPQWVEYINSHYAGRLEVQPGEVTLSVSDSLPIRLRKLPEAPAHFPFQGK